MSLGELRQAILAVYVGNPLFTPEEQLQANHQAHEYEGVQELSRWLQAARLTDAQRAKAARWHAASTVPQPGVCLDAATQQAELGRMMRCQALSKHARYAYASVFALSATSRPRARLAILGNGYLEALENLGNIPAHPGFEAIYDN